MPTPLEKRHLRVIRKDENPPRVVLPFATPPPKRSALQSFIGLFRTNPRVVPIASISGLTTPNNNPPPDDAA